MRTVPFKAKFNAPLVAGEYRFNQVNYIAAPISKGYIYEIKSLYFSSNVSENVFTDALNNSVNDGSFLIQFKTRLGGFSQNTGLVPMPGFAQYMPIELDIKSNNNSVPVGGGDETDNILVTLDGGLIQTPELITLGKTSIDVFLSVNMYEKAISQQHR